MFAMPGSRPLEFIFLIELEIWPRSSLFLTASFKFLLRRAQAQSPFFVLSLFYSVLSSSGFINLSGDSILCFRC